MNPPERLIAPSLLASDYGFLANEAFLVKVAEGDWLHIDIMDGHFVDNLTFGPGVVSAIRDVIPEVYFDVHLMITRPDRFWQRFAEAGANNLTVHVEAEHDVAQTLREIRESGCSAGLALNPATPIESVEPYLEMIDLLLVMTVVPGRGGQPFIRETLPKIEQAYQWKKERRLDYHIEVDGGIDLMTIGDANNAGANVFVAGTSVFVPRSTEMQATEMFKNVKALRGEPEKKWPQR